MQTEVPVTNLFPMQCRCIDCFGSTITNFSFENDRRNISQHVQCFLMSQKKSNLQKNGQMIENAENEKKKKTENPEK